jgi:hypothetical protein
MSIIVAASPPMLASAVAQRSSERGTFDDRQSSEVAQAPHKFRIGCAAGENPIPSARTQLLVNVRIRQPERPAVSGGPCQFPLDPLHDARADLMLDGNFENTFVSAARAARMARSFSKPTFGLPHVFPAFLPLKALIATTLEFLKSVDAKKMQGTAHRDITFSRWRPEDDT